MLLYDDPVIQVRTPLYASACPRIDNTPKNAAASGAEWRPTSIMEPLDMGHCISALIEGTFYEGAI